MLFGLASAVAVLGMVASCPRSAFFAAAQSITTMAVAIFVMLPI